MRRILTTAGAIALVLVLSGALAASAGPDITTAKTMKFTTMQTSSVFLQLAKPGAPPTGDEFIFTQNAMQNGTKVGTVAGKCTFIAHKGDLCEAALVLQKGQISVDGFSPLRNKFSLPITGGTFAYQNVRGQVDIDNLTNTTSTVTVHLLP